MIPVEMDAVTIARFGGPEVLEVGRRPVPAVGTGQVLIRVACAGVGAWDPFEREGGFVAITGEEPSFPFIPGGDGSGTVVAVGAGVDRVGVGDVVYARGPGFYAEYVAVDADAVSPLPAGLDLLQSGAMPIVALTALQGLVHELRITAGQTVLITGASGDVGLVAVQLATGLGARVLAVASGDDGVAAARDLGAEVAVDGRTGDVAAGAQQIAPDGLDSVLSLVGGAVQDTAARALRPGGRLAYPLGVEPEPAPIDGVEVLPFDMTIDSPERSRQLMSELADAATRSPFSVVVSQVLPLAQVVDAQQALGAHRVGKIVLEVSPEV